MSELTDQLEAAGQARLAASVQALSGEAQNRLALQCAALDLPLLQHLVQTMVRDQQPAAHHGDIGPAVVDRLSDHPDGRAEARAVGEQALRDNRVAVVLLAGGQGTRLGFDAPKGMFPIGPVTMHSLFAIHAAGVGATRRDYGCDLPFLLMTSPTNDADTVAYLEKHAMFGLDPRTVATFVQGVLPAVDPSTGDVLLEAPDRMALSPDGHGGIFRAMERAAVLGDLEERGIDVIMTMQVDNPLMRPADPEFIGAHLMAQAEMSTLVVAKTAPEERMGVMATVDGSVTCPCCGRTMPAITSSSVLLPHPDGPTMAVTSPAWAVICTPPSTSRGGSSPSARCTSSTWMVVPMSPPWGMRYSLRWHYPVRFRGSRHVCLLSAVQAAPLYAPQGINPATWPLCGAALHEFDAVAVGVLDEADERATRA